MKSKKKDSKFSKWIVGIVIALNVIFTSVILVAFFVTQTEPATLITCFFSFTTVELWSLSKIKRDKDKNHKDDE